VPLLRDDCSSLVSDGSMRHRVTVDHSEPRSRTHARIFSNTLSSDLSRRGSPRRKATATLRSSLKFGLVDWGKNNSNLDFVEKAVSQALDDGGAAS
jgi:hypothetical protein